jgi:phage terminase Nu1 subunit (DNA packaging protein)
MGRWTGNKASLAEFFEVSAPTVDDWIRRDCPVETRGKPGQAWVFDFRAVRRWREAYIVQHAGSSKDASTAQAVRRKVLAEARLKELELAKVEGSLADVELIRRGLDGVIVHQRTILLGLPSQIGRDIDEPKLRLRIVAVVDRRVREALEVLANYDPIITPRTDADGARDDDDSGGAAPARPKKAKVKK